jgi:hypothetical protein
MENCLFIRIALAAIVGTDAVGFVNIDSVTNARTRTT